MQEHFAANDADRKLHRALVGDAEIRRFMTSLLLRLAALAFAIAFAAQTAADVSSAHTKGEQPNGAGTTIAAEITR